MSCFVEALSCRDNSEINIYISCGRYTVCETNASHFNNAIVSVASPVMDKKSQVLTDGE